MDHSIYLKAMLVPAVSPKDVKLWAVQQSGGLTLTKRGWAEMGPRLCLCVVTLHIQHISSAASVVVASTHVYDVIVGKHDVVATWTQHGGTAFPCVTAWVITMYMAGEVLSGTTSWYEHLIFIGTSCMAEESIGQKGHLAPIICLKFILLHRVQRHSVMLPGDCNQSIFHRHQCEVCPWDHHGGELQPLSIAGVVTECSVGSMGAVSSHRYLSTHNEQEIIEYCDGREVPRIFDQRKSL